MKPNREIKKKKTGSRISSRDLGQVSDSEIEEVISPKKQNKIRLETLRSSSITDRNHRIGAIMTLPELQDGIVRKGEVKNVRIICTVTDNRIGRTVGTDAERSSNRFLYLADCTGYLTLGVNAIEVGIRKHDTANGECTDETRNFFSAIVTGNIAWIPSRNSQKLPTFFLNKGSIEKVELDSWSGDSRFMLPTTDICTQMVKSTYRDSALFGTTGICGRVDKVCKIPSGVLAISLEDPVGYSAFNIHPVRDDESAESLIQDHGIVQGSFLFVKGKIKVDNLPHSENAVLEMASTDGIIAAVSRPRYSDYVKDLRKIDDSFFKGIVPEDM